MDEFLCGGSVPLRVYVLRPLALRAYAATPSFDLTGGVLRTQPLNGTTIEERASQRGLVGELELCAHGQSGSDARHGDAEWSDETLEVCGGGFALDGGIGGEDDLSKRSGREADDELTDFEIGGRDAVEWRNGAVQDVESPVKFVGGLDGDEVLRGLDDTEEIFVAHGVRASFTGRNFAEVLAYFAKDDAIPGVGDGE